MVVFSWAGLLDHEKERNLCVLRVLSAAGGDCFTVHTPILSKVIRYADVFSHASHAGGSTQTRASRHPPGE